MILPISIFIHFHIFKAIALMRFHVLVLTLNHKCVFSTDDVISPHSLLRDVTLINFD